MAFDNDQKEFNLPAGKDNGARESAEFLPKYFRTPVNQKFLHSTLDQLISQGTLEKLNAYYGRTVTSAYQPSDLYVPEINSDRENYKFEPSVVQKDELGNVNFYSDYIDFINQIKNFNGDTTDHSVVNAQEYYAWSPKIDWDKFVNYREYFWMPYGASIVTINGQQRDVVSTYKVTVSDQGDNYAYLFTPDGLTLNPTLKLYKGQTYKFDIQSEGLPFVIRTQRILDDSYNYMNGIDVQSVENGIITFQIKDNAPDKLYYGSSNDINAWGLIQIFDIDENSSIDVENEIIGKVNYTTADGIALSNGMKVNFRGNVTPEKYADGDYYVEGVGESIQLIPSQDLEVVSSFTTNVPIPFDSQNFDTVGFGTATSFAINKDYIVCNRASPDRNPWARHNRWVHRSVIEASASANGQVADIDQLTRARRPIIEFEPGIKLFNFGTESKGNVDLIDTVTEDVMSDVEGSQGFYVDGVQLTNGLRVLFTADKDQLVKDKIFEVKFIDFTENNTTTRQITLVEIQNSEPNNGETVLITNGNANQGKWFYYNNGWKLGQEKTATNQTPLFDMFDNSGNSFSDSILYPNSSFAGNKIFSYSPGEGIDDAELGFPLKYLNVENIGDIVFDFNLLNETYVYQSQSVNGTLISETGFLKKYDAKGNFTLVNGWQTAPTESFQKVNRQYVVNANQSNDFAIDVYDKSGDLNDLKVNVFLNNVKQVETVDYFILRLNSIAYVKFYNDLNVDDILLIRTISSSPKNDNGHYEFPSNLQSNPLNEKLSSFTVGQVTDHVKSITNELEDIVGVTPGVSNLRDFPDATAYGRKFLQHSGPMVLSSYLLNNKEINIINAITKSQNDYYKFKRSFVIAMDDLGFDGTSKQICDKILQRINKDNNNSLPYFLTDMLGIGAFKSTNHEVLDTDNAFFALSNTFDLNNLSTKAVYVYHNGTQLLYGHDYIFADGFVQVTKTLSLDDVITVNEYETTNGSHIPATPTKLGLYPKFTPKKYLDTTAIDPVNVIQGHDGSIIVAFNDFRDDVILELEKRIYNNIKVQFDENVYGIKNFIPRDNTNNKFSVESINKTLLGDFNDWLTFIGNEDYTANNYHSDDNSLTWNYSNMISPIGEKLLGHWRGIYKYAFDTDRPNITPWEMLGYTEEPAWWTTTYGPAPYTKDNLILWQDLEKGIVREPGKKIVIRENYKRLGLTNHIPVDSEGRVRSPFDCAYARGAVLQLTKQKFKFGDQAPIENAWRRSVHYPFALLKSYIIHQPNKAIGVGFDVSRTNRNASGQIVYNSATVLRPIDVVFPSSVNEDTISLTAGLVNYIFEIVENSKTTNYADYKSEFASLGIQVGFKIRGYSNKNNFKLLIDSKTPLNSTTLFVPDENYELIYNVSTPIEILTYSGLIIEKLPSGYSVKGYDKNDPYIRYHDYFEQNNDPTITVGGVSASFVNWSANKRYDRGAYVKFSNEFYAVDETHVASETFDISKFVKLVELPLEGGATATLRKKFIQTDVVEIAYGTVFDTVQQVVDLIQGYDSYLKSKGFEFDQFDQQSELVANWQLSVKEFLFWTTQNWDEGAVISLSPASKKLVVNSKFSTTDNVVENFYSYGVLKEDGNNLDRNNLRIVRKSNRFELFTKNTVNGIYFAKVPLVQKEHVCLIDNTTDFNDLIYDPASGYKQDRIKMLGYITEWDGSLNIPGFIFDEARVKEWQPFTDYAMSDVVKYKEFYYTANTKLKGTATFETNNWRRLDGKPSSSLLANFDYKTNQFADFYDLDTDNFDSDQQKLAQHLIGYQPREYLRNIINDDVSQYKFYQGFIREKGTANSLNKLFDALASADKESLEFFEEWAIRKGQYGAVDTFDEIEYKLDESLVRLNPQPILLTDESSNTGTDLVYRIQSGQTYLSPQDYQHTPFPVKYDKNTYIRTAGPVNPIDISLTLSQYDDLLTDTKVADLNEGEYVWIGNYNKTWTVFKYIATQQTTISIVKDSNIITVNTVNNAVMNPGEIFVVNVDGTDYVLKCTSVNGTEIVCEDKEGFVTVDPANGYIKRFITHRLASINDINTVIDDKGLEDNEKFWIDESDDGKWKIVNNKFVFSTHNEVSSTSTSGDESFGTVIAANKQNSTLLVSQPTDGDGKIYVFARGTESGSLKLSQVIEAPTSDPLLQNVDLFDTDSSFGQAMDISPNGNFIVIGAPDAGNLKTEYKGIYNQTSTYNVGNIVQYKNQLWRATNAIEGAKSADLFSTFDASAFADENIGFQTVSLLIGDSVFLNETTDHILIRASAEQFSATKVGDTLILKYLDFSTQYPIDRNNYSKSINQPFNGVGAPTIKNNVFNETPISIQEKIDEILEIDLTITDPPLGSIVSTDTAEGTVAYVRKIASKTLLYLRNTSGVFSASGQLLLDTLPVGNYSRVNTDDYAYLGGWWKVDIGASVTTNCGQDVTNNAVITDIKLLNEVRETNLFFSSLEETIAPITPQDPVVRAQFGIGTSYESYYIDPATNSWQINPSPVARLSNKWFVRTGYELAHDSATNSRNSAGTFSVWFNNVDQGAFDFSDLNIDQDDTNGLKEVVDVWEGYIDIDSQPDNNVNYYFPEAGIHKIYDPITFVEAEVGFVQFIGLEKIRVYFRNRRNTVDPNGSKRFSAGSDAGNPSTIVRTGGGVNRLLGSIEQTVQSGATDGDILVFEHTTPITVSGSPNFYFVNDIEYWIWDEQDSVEGIPQSANIPNSQNKDWTQVYNIPIGEGTQSGLSNQGAFLIYKKDTKGQYQYNSAFTVPDTQSDLRLGARIQVREVAGTTVAYISAEGNGTSNLPGKIYFVKYNTNKNWWLGVDEFYMGLFDENTDYLQNELVIYNNQLYKAKTNVSSGVWNVALWELQSSHTDFLGYVPNDSGVELEGDSTLDQTRLIKFARTFDVDTNGVNIVVSNQYSDNDQNVVVYRLDNEHYTYRQTIIPPADSAPTINFGADISISEDGELIAVGSPLKDITDIDMGVVYVYKKLNDGTGQYTLQQTLSSPSKEISEQFGNTLSFSGDVLAVTSLQGDQQVDDGSTILDTRYDVGSVHLFEKFENTLLYAEKFSYANSFNQFGTHLLVNNNHVYIGLPELQLTDKEKGTVVDFRKAPNETNWSSIHQSIDGIDQPDLSKIQGIFLYDSSTNKLLTRLDYVDPIFGKIPGPAEAEIYYKTNYDPAIYNSDNAVGVVDKTNHWNETQVGRLWWNISTAQYYYPYQSNIIFNNSYWNKLFVGASIDVHEWTESIYTPTQYNAISQSVEGEALGLTGTVSNPNDFVTKKVYDKIAGTLSNRYYFWVKSKSTVPQIESRSLSALAVEKLIKDPRSQGYKYVTMFGKNKFAIVNCQQFIQDKNTVISFRIKTIDSNNNIHKEYALLTEGSAESTLPKDIESVWFNSLIGYDEQINPVPDPNLSEKLKYGTLQIPRQSWFANKQEALKQTVQRINSVLKQNLIVDEVDLSNLTQSDPAPNSAIGLYDVTVDTEKDLDFVGIGSVRPASVNITIENGKLIDIVVTDPGKGYKTIPTYKINSLTGTDAVIGFTIDNDGSVNSAKILKEGKNYSANAKIQIRNFSALVSSDSTIDGKWAVYKYVDGDGWQKSKIQAYNVNLYWQYEDWYGDGYSQYTAIDHVVSQSYEINGLDIDLNQIVKINNIGSGGWLLLKKIDNQPDVDYTINYETIGRQNGTIQFSDKLYIYSGNVGYDSNSFDIQLYDRQPIQETRIILETVRDKIYVEELATEYNKLFFVGINYALSENKLNDFVFKTSFVRAKHNVGELSQKITFKNDNLSNYEDYVNEVKPYKSKVREYVSSYQKTEPTNTVITDFDLPPKFINGQIVSSKITVFDDELIGADNINSYPDKNWKDNVGYQITGINIADAGSEYKNPPAVNIVGGGGAGATARAYIKNGSVNRIVVTNPGSGYISSPTITLSRSTTGTQAKASVVLGNSLPRTTHIGIKFDRSTGTTLITNLNRSETFIGNNSRLKFNLKWPMDLRTNTIEVLINGTKQLKSSFTYGNQVDNSKSYQTEKGYIQFIIPPVNLGNISVSYKINEDVLNTADRFELYQPTAGMAGKELAQVIDGIDYGGVEVRSIGFEDTSGWGNEPYMTSEWDTFDETYEDEVFYLDGSTQTLNLAKTLENGVEYHVYQNGTRVDDPNYDNGNPTNTLAQMNSIQGDGSSKIVDISMLETEDDDVIIVRKSTSDGSFLPEPGAVDTLVKGGDLAYSTAQGINAEDINIDGDGFVTETSAKGPEEFVPGQVLDTLDIQVYDRGANSGSKINSYNYIGDGITTDFDFVENPQSNTAVFVSVDNILYSSDRFSIDYQNRKLIFDQAPQTGAKINFIMLGNNGESILDIDQFIGDGSTIDFVTRAKYTQGSIQTFVKVNGEDADYTVIETDSNYAVPNRVAVRFNTAPAQDSVINIVIYESTAQSFSEVTQNIFTADGSTTSYQLSPTPFNQTPFTDNVIVKVDNSILRSGFHKKFILTNLREYEFENWQLLPGTVISSDVRVYLNKNQLNSAQYTWNPGNSSVTLTGGVGSIGDVLDVYVDNGAYSVSDTGVLSLNVSPAQDSTITAYQFSNHDVQDIDRTQYDVIAKLTITVNTDDYYQYNQLTNGVVKLNKPAVDAQYVWVSVNGEWLAPSIDYTVSNDQMYLKISRSLSQSDELDVIHFTAPSFVGKFAYRQFKDIMNRTHFKRVGDDRQYFLAQNLNWYDKEIVLTDATGITEPSVSSQLPGIIFLDGERIEYYQKDGNKLQQLRRGTFGTSIAEVHHANTEVYDQSSFQNVPYQDQFISETYTGADVVNNTLNIGFVPNNVNEFEIFVGGKRLRKNAISVYDPIAGQDSPEADVTASADFSVDGTTARISFIETPAENAKIVLVRKQGRIWQSGSDPLSQTENDIARFIRQKEVAVPQ